MKAYWVLNYDITNPEAFEIYRPLARPLINELVKQGKAKILVVNDNVSDSTIEGTPKGTVIIIEFASREFAKEFYYSKEYQEVLALRTDNSDGWAVIVDGFEQ